MAAVLVSCCHCEKSKIQRKKYLVSDPVKFRIPSSVNVVKETSRIGTSNTAESIQAFSQKKQQSLL
jgi:hypothetical protein